MQRRVYVAAFGYLLPVPKSFFKDYDWKKYKKHSLILDNDNNVFIIESINEYVVILKSLNHNDFLKYFEDK